MKRAWSAVIDLNKSRKIPVHSRVLCLISLDLHQFLSLFLFFFFLFLSDLIPASYTGTFDFLNIPESGIHEIASKSGLSTIEGIGSVLANPAGFAGNTQRTFMISDTENMADTRKMGLFYGQNLLTMNVIAGVRYFYLKDEINDNSRTLGYDSTALDLVAARKFDVLNGLDLGLHLAFLSSRLGPYKSTLLLVQPGVMYRMSVPGIGQGFFKKNLVLGFYMNNLGFVLGPYQAEEKLPLNISLGLSYSYLQIKFISSSLYLNYIYDTLASSCPAASLSIGLFRMIDLSAAYQFMESVHPFSLGIRVKAKIDQKEYGFSYTIMPAGDLDPVHCISLTVSI